MAREPFSCGNCGTDLDADEAPLGLCDDCTVYCEKCGELTDGGATTEMTAGPFEHLALCFRCAEDEYEALDN
jgi:hypothetical protein